MPLISFLSGLRDLALGFLGIVGGMALVVGLLYGILYVGVYIAVLIEDHPKTSAIVGGSLVLVATLIVVLI